MLRLVQLAGAGCAATSTDAGAADIALKLAGFVGGLGVRLLFSFSAM